MLLEEVTESIDGPESAERGQFLHTHGCHCQIVSRHLHTVFRRESAGRDPQFFFEEKPQVAHAGFRLRRHGSQTGIPSGAAVDVFQRSMNHRGVADRLDVRPVL